MRDEIMEVKREIEEVKEKSFALELISDYKKQNKRQFIVVLIILTMWFASIGLFIYYINTTGYEETITETAETDDGGNTCVGDNCNNGVINDKGKQKNN